MYSITPFYKIKMMKTIYTDLAELHFDESQSILYVKILEDVHVDMEKIQEHYKIINEVTKGQKYSALVDATNYFTSDDDALRYAALPEVTRARVATAFHSLNLANRLTIHFYRLLYKPNFAINLFRTSDTALEWLKLEQNACLAS